MIAKWSNIFRKLQSPNLWQPSRRVSSSVFVVIVSKKILSYFHIIIMDNNKQNDLDKTIFVAAFARAKIENIF